LIAPGLLVRLRGNVPLSSLKEQPTGCLWPRRTIPLLLRHFERVVNFDTQLPYRAFETIARGQ